MSTVTKFTCVACDPEQRTKNGIRRPISVTSDELFDFVTHVITEHAPVAPVVVAPVVTPVAEQVQEPISVAPVAVAPVVSAVGPVETPVQTQDQGDTISAALATQATE